MRRTGRARSEAGADALVGHQGIGHQRRV
jgi:hypothetical protein